MTRPVLALALLLTACAHIPPEHAPPSPPCGWGGHPSGQPGAACLPSPCEVAIAKRNTACDAQAAIMLRGETPDRSVIDACGAAQRDSYDVCGVGRPEPMREPAATPREHVYLPQQWCMGFGRCEPVHTDGGER